ncbi:ABC transporter permease [Stygiolobus caldivivus]|uniref:Sulfate ABC transporter permease n=1 Tax=Stygiolobus caldivivus TaxID=2824673 RepID=A0A8D5U4B3_9CREN|nr:ABC transporter permease [Stygiolobus caldivivus]BCU69161.1 sulfate ABC transporter permease [Stygiolobus caldivivus]
MVATSRLFKVLSFFLSILLAIPIIYLVIYGYGPFYVKSVAFGKQLISSIELSYLASAVAVIVIVIVFTPLAYFLARYKNPLIESIVDIPASIPHPLVGIALVFIDSPTNIVGKFLTSHGINFYYSYTGLFLALIIVSAPIYIRSMQSFFESLPLHYEQYAMGLGHSELGVFFKMVFPMSIGGMVSSGLTSMARAISEFGSIAIVAPFVQGWIFNGDCVASVYIYNEYQTYFNASITASATLIVFSLILLATARISRYVLIRKGYIYY